MTTSKKGRIGSSFSDHLREQGNLEETNATAVKRVLAWQLENAMQESNMSKNQMAKKMSTSRTQLNRILDPENDKLQLDTVIKAARVLGREVRIELV
jgi:predicted XRE-type DNA-binding protein